MTPKQVLATLAARWPWALAVLLLCVAAATTISLTMFKRYTATATVMLDARSGDQVAGGAPNALLPSGYLATQMELIASERVGRAVIRELGLQNDVTWREAWLAAGEGRGDFEAWLSEMVAKGLSVRPAALSSVVTVAYTAEDAAKSALFANAYIKVYSATALEIRNERVRQVGTFFEARGKDLRADVEAAQSRLAAFQQKNGLLVGDDRLDLEATRLSDLAAQMVRLQGTNAEVAGRLSQAGRQTEQLQEVWRNPAVAALNADITREEVRLQELTARLGESHPQLIEQQARLGELKARLGTEKGKAVSNVGFDNSANQARLAQVTAAHDAQRAKVLRMQGQREQATALQRDVENAQRAVDSMQQRVGQAGIESQNNHANLIVLKHATVPMSPSSPKLLKNIGASVAVGLLLGIGLVLGLEQLDRRLRTPDDLVELKQTMLILLPVSLHAHEVLDTSRTKLMKQRVLTGLPRPPQLT